jgi:hypothetical protein
LSLNFIHKPFLISAVVAILVIFIMWREINFFLWNAQVFCDCEFANY